MRRSYWQVGFTAVWMDKELFCLFGGYSKFGIASIPLGHLNFPEKKSPASSVRWVWRMGTEWYSGCHVYQSSIEEGGWWSLCSVGRISHNLPVLCRCFTPICWCTWCPWVQHFLVQFPQGMASSSLTLSLAQRGRRTLGCRHTIGTGPWLSKQCPGFSPWPLTTFCHVSCPWLLRSSREAPGTVSPFSGMLSSAGWDS